MLVSFIHCIHSCRRKFTVALSYFIHTTKRIARWMFHCLAQSICNRSADDKDMELESHLLAHAYETVSIFTVCGAADICYYFYWVCYARWVCVWPMGRTSTRTRTPCFPSVLSCYALMSVCVCVFVQQWKKWSLLCTASTARARHIWLIISMLYHKSA